MKSSGIFDEDDLGQDSPDDEDHYAEVDNDENGKDKSPRNCSSGKLNPFTLPKVPARYTGLTNLGKTHVT